MSDNVSRLYEVFAERSVSKNLGEAKGNHIAAVV